jgi:hypothetical protein
LPTEAVLVIKLLKALTALRAKPAFAKATADEGGKEGTEFELFDRGF